MNRRRAVAVLFSVATGLRLRGEEGAAPPPDYAKDVEFLLSEFEQKARHFFALKEIDWSKVRSQFREEAKAVKNDGEHLVLCSRLVARLRDGHAAMGNFHVPMLETSQSEKRRFTGPGVHLLPIGDRIYVRQALGAAADAGVKQGMEVTAIDGLPAPKWLDQTIDRTRNERGASTRQMERYLACHSGLGDWEGTKITFDFLEDQEGRTSSVTLIRSGGSNFWPLGPVNPPPKLATVGRQSYGRTARGFGYIHLRNISDDLPEQIDKMLSTMTWDAKGLILDTRANEGGGCDHEAVFGRFIPSGKSWRQYRSAGRQPFAGPMVVIVDAGTRSAGETVAGNFKEDGRAWMIGDEPTAGMSAQKTVITVPSGMFSVRFAIASNKGRFNAGRGIEGIGVPPHEVTPYEVADLAKGVDTQIRRAEEFLLSGWPKDRVPWEG